MLSQECFVTEFLEFLCPHFNKTLTNPRLIEAYQDAFDRYSDKTFTQLCKFAFQECKFMPEPQWFADRAVMIAASQLAEAESFGALPSAQMRELENMSDKTREENILRLREMMKSVDSRSREERTANINQLRKMMGAG